MRGNETTSAENLQAAVLKTQIEKEAQDREFQKNENEKNREIARDELELKKKELALKEKELALKEKEIASKENSKESDETDQPGGRKVVDEKIGKDGDPLEEERKEQEDIRENSTTKTVAKDGWQFLNDYNELVKNNKNPSNVSVDPNYNNSIIENLKNDLSCLEAMQDLTNTRKTQDESIKKIQELRSKVRRFDNKKDQFKRLEKLNAEKANICSNRTYAAGGNND